MRGGTGNRILDALPAAACRAFHKSLVNLAAGTELVGQGERMTHAFFPTTAVCSMVVGSMLARPPKTIRRSAEMCQ